MTKKLETTRPPLALALDSSGTLHARASADAGPQDHASRPQASSTVERAQAASQASQHNNEIHQARCASRASIEVGGVIPSPPTLIKEQWVDAVGKQLARFPDDQDHTNRIYERLSGIPHHVLTADIREMMLENRATKPTADSRWPRLVQRLQAKREKGIEEDAPAIRDLRPRFLCHPAGAGACLVVFTPAQALALLEQGYRVVPAGWREQDMPEALQEQEPEEWIEEDGRRMERTSASACAHEVAGCKTWGERLGYWGGER